MSKNPGYGVGVLGLEVKGVAGHGEGMGEGWVIIQFNHEFMRLTDLYLLFLSSIFSPLSVISVHHSPGQFT